MTWARIRFAVGTRRRAITQPLETRRRTAFYKQFLGPGDLCFDVGAHVGERTALFLRTGASVVAIEPLAGCLEKLRSRFSDEPRVILVDQAVELR